MISLKVLRSTLLKLKKNEINSLVSFLKSHRKESTDQSLKSVQLVKLLLKNKEYSSDAIQKILYKKINYHAFNKLIIRLLDTIQEIIIFDVSLFRSDHYVKRNQKVFEIKKRLLQCEVMYLRGMNEGLESFLNKIIDMAKKYEMYDCLIGALKTKQKYLGFRFGSKPHMQIQAEINFYDQSRFCYNRAENIFYSLASKINFSSSDFKYKYELDNAIGILKKDVELTQSATITYYYFFLLVDYYQNNFDYLSAKSTLMSMRKLLSDNICIYTKSKMNITIINIANNDLLLYDFENSLSDIRESLSSFPDDATNASARWEVEFYVLFNTGKLTKSEKLIEQLYHDSRTMGSPFLYSKHACLFAWVKTLKGDFFHSNELLKEAKEIEKEKEGWALGVKILSIINYIGLENYEGADREIEKLKKHISKNASEKVIRKRYVGIQDVFCELMKQGYDFKRTYRSKQKEFAYLASNDLDYRWELKSPEMIIFHEWFKSKAEGNPYDHSAAVQKEKVKNLKLMKQ